MKNKKKCYYAHTMISYNSTIEESDIKLLESLDFEVINPNTKQHSDGCQEYVRLFGNSSVMDYFRHIVNKCDLVAFRSLPKGEILSGVAAEVEHALLTGKPVIELPSNLPNRFMNYPETKKYLIDLGFYKTKT